MDLYTTLLPSGPTPVVQVPSPIALRSHAGGPFFAGRTAHGREHVPRRPPGRWSRDRRSARGDAHRLTASYHPLL